MGNGASKQKRRASKPDVLNVEGSRPLDEPAAGRQQDGDAFGGEGTGAALRTFAEQAEGGAGETEYSEQEPAAALTVSGDNESDSDVEFDRTSRPIARPARMDIVPSEAQREDLRHPVVESSVPDGWVDYHSTDPPSDQLELEFIYGYRAHDQRNNLHYSASGELVYPAATLCVVYDPVRHSQRFFAGHTAEVSCLCAHRDGEHMASGQAQLGGSSEPAPIFVWSAVSLEAVVMLPGAHDGGVAAVAFAHEGWQGGASSESEGGGLDPFAILCSLGHDAFHSLVVWNWVSGHKLAQARAHTASLFALAVSVDSRGELSAVTAGARSLKFWALDGPTLRSKKGGFGEQHAHITGQLGALRDSPTFTAVEFLRTQSGQLLAGTSRGELMLWADGELAHYVKSGTAPIFAIAAWASGVVSGGKDGRVTLWPAEWPTTLEASVAPLRVFELRQMVRGFSDAAGRPRTLAGSSVPCVRALACSGDRILVGTRTAEVFELSFEAGLDLPALTLVVQGHAVHSHAQAEAEGAGTSLAQAQLGSGPRATHVLSLPAADELVVTAGADRTLRVWSAARKCMLGMRLVSHAVDALAASADGSALAVALADGLGSVVLMAVSTLADELVLARDEPSPVGALAFSPNGSWLAVGTGQGCVEVFAALDGCRLHGVCRALEASVSALCWSEDSLTLMSNSRSFELAFWDVRTCEQLPPSATRGTAWAGWRCPLGWASQGVYSRFEQPGSVLCVERSRDGATLAVGDGYGGVSLFAFPACSFAAGTVSYLAHGGPVAGLAWTASDGSLLTVGERDGCVMQWRHVGSGVSAHGSDLPGAGAAGALPYAPLAMEDVDSEVEEEMEAAREGASGPGAGRAISEASATGSIAKVLGQPLVPSHGLGLGLGAAVPPGYAAIHAPTGWEADEMSGEVPDAHLELEHAYGYSGWARGALGLTDAGELVYAAASLCVIASVRARSPSQRYFAGHTGAVCAIAMHPSGAVCASAQGGLAPYVCVWDAASSLPLATLRGVHSGGIGAIAFSHDGRLLASIGTDSAHTLAVYDWERSVLVARTSAGADWVCALAFSPEGGLATAGAQHLRYWSLEALGPRAQGTGARAGGLASTSALVGKSAALHELRAASVLLCVAFSPRGACVTGTAHGELLLWEAGSLARSVRAHAGAVHALVLRGDSFVSAGRASKLAFWSCELDPLGSLDARASLEALQDEFGRPLGCSAASLSVRALATDGARVFAGTLAGELFELAAAHSDGDGGGAEAGQARLLVAGQGRPLRRGFILGGVAPGAAGGFGGAPGSGGLRALALSPTEGLAATIGDDGALRLWHLASHAHRALRRMAAGGTALAFSPDGQWLLVGLDDGSVELLDARTLHTPTPGASERAVSALLGAEALPLAAGQAGYGGGGGGGAGAGARRGTRAHCAGGAVCDLKWAPDGSLVAAASAGGSVHVLAPLDGLRRRHVLAGHSRRVLHLDWSEEALVVLSASALESGGLGSGVGGGGAQSSARWLLRSVSSSAELLFWEVPAAHSRVSAEDVAAGARRVARPAMARDVVWASHTCPLQWAAIGAVQPPAAGGGGAAEHGSRSSFGIAHSVDVSREGDCLAAADASGTLSLLRFPACLPGAPTKRYVAHAGGGAAAVRFSHDDQHLLSAGGSDGCLLQWRYVADAAAAVAAGADSAEDEDLAADLAPLAVGAAAVAPARRRASAPVGAKRELLRASSGAQAARSGAVPFWEAQSGGARSGKGGGALGLREADGGVELLRRLELETSLRAPGAMAGARPWLAELAPPEHARRGAEASLAAPAERLSLEFVHGVRAHGCRGQLHVSAAGEIVFFAAAVGVVMRVAGVGGAAPSQRHYLEHGGEVLCMALHPAGVLVASGEEGERAAVHVWSSRSLGTEAVLAGAQRAGVGALAFSPDGSLLASSDASAARTIALWNWRTGTLLSLTRGGAGAILGLSFSPADSTMVSYGQRHLRFWARPLAGGGGGGGGWAARKGDFGAVGPQTVLCAAWLPSSGALVTGTSRGLVLEWAQGRVVRSARLHAQWPVFAIAVSSEGIAVGGRGGRLMLWPSDSSPADARAARPVELGQMASGLTDEYGRLRCLFTEDAPCVRALAFAQGSLLLVSRSGELWQLGGGRPHCRLLLQGHCAMRTPVHPAAAGARSEVWGLAAHPQQPHIFATAGEDCTVRLWDAQQRGMACMRRVRSSPGCLSWAPDGSLLAVGCHDGSVLLLEAGSLTELPARIGSAQAGGVSALAFSPDSALLAVGYADGLVEVVHAVASAGGAALRLHGAHGAHVRSLDWSADGELLQSCDAAMLLCWWDVRAGGVRILDAALVSDAHWASWSSPVGWPVAGILPQLSDGTDIHAVSRSHSQRLLVTADEFGKLNLFRYPATLDGSACRLGVAHAGHVSGAAWSCDDSRIFTTGGADLTVMQWKVGGHGSRTADHAALQALDDERG